MQLSIVIPVYNGAGSIEGLTKAIVSEFSTTSFEVILVNDGSSDNSESICERIASSDPRIKFISLRKNFGEHNAVMCGLNFANGELVAIIDDDFQNPPSEIRKLMKRAEAGYDVVYSYYTKKRHSLFRNIGSSINDFFATILISKPRGLYLSSFKLIRAEVVKEIVKYRGPFPYLDGLIFRATKNIASELVEHKERAIGPSNYTFRKLMSLFLNMFLNFSVLPLRLFMALGALIFCGSLIFSIIVIIEKLSSPQIPIGYASILIAVLMLAGIQILFMGLIGEYLGKLYMDQNGTPQWVIRKKVLHTQE